MLDRNKNLVGARSGIASANLASWAVPSRVARYRDVFKGWADDGERIALNSIADEVRGQPVLDIGVGAGRTASLMRLLTDDYVAIDWSPEMVKICAATHPGIDVRRGDARDLSEFPSSHYKLVLFSFNGIDSLDHPDRSRVFDEVRNVLRPDGIFAYSTLSKSGPMYGERPLFHGPGFPSLRRIGSAVLKAPEQLPNLPRRYANWRTNKEASEDNGDWGLWPVAAVDFNLAHFATVEGERKLLSEHGFVVSELFAPTGEALAQPAAGFPWFFVIARPAIS